MKFNPNDVTLQELKDSIKDFGISQLKEAWDCLLKVWASKFNERAHLAVRKIGVAPQQIFMSVLIQEVVKAQYAFVIHTINPTNGNTSEIYVEVCRGLGESLVSDKPG